VLLEFIDDSNKQLHKNRIESKSDVIIVKTNTKTTRTIITTSKLAGD
jgi:hypothetical protein